MAYNSRIGGQCFVWKELVVITTSDAYFTFIVMNERVSRIKTYNLVVIISINRKEYKSDRNRHYGIVLN